MGKTRQDNLSNVLNILRLDNYSFKKNKESIMSILIKKMLSIIKRTWELLSLYAPLSRNKNSNGHSCNF